MKSFNTLLLPLVASVASALPTTATASSMPTVTLDYSTIVATAGSDAIGYYKYQNIRYAAAPTGDLRFAEPQWPSVETVINNGSLATADVDCATYEDCLFVDVWAPANSTGKSLPVLVWTYGGGFTAGSKAENTPEGLFALSTEFIFVTYNYRLGMTGLAGGPSLLHEGGMSNVALWDAAHIFEWTKKYIGNFGGNPDEITAMGFSAGASQVLFQMTKFSGRTEQPFARAYICSPGYVPGAGHYLAEQFWQNVSTSAGCTGGSLDCMRQIDFDTLNTAANDMVDAGGYRFQPRVDGGFVADTFEAQFYQQRFNFSGPLVITHELHESNSKPYGSWNTSAGVISTLQSYFPAITDDIVDEILELYPESDYTSEGLRFADMEQSLDLTAHNYAVTTAMKNQTWNALVTLGEATHGTDMNYYWYSNFTLVTDNSTSSSGTAGTGAVTSTDIDTNISLKMQKYLVSFILTGNPNTMWPDDKLYWPQHGGNSSSVGTELVFNSTFYTQDDSLANDKSIFWNKALWY